MPNPPPKFYESLVLSLAFTCPFGEAAHDCPMAELRKLPLALRMEKVVKMDCECQKNIYLAHRVCLAKREGKPIETTHIGLRRTANLSKKINKSL